MYVFFCEQKPSLLYHRPTSLEDVKFVGQTVYFFEKTPISCVAQKCVFTPNISIGINLCTHFFIHLAFQLRAGDSRSRFIGRSVSPLVHQSVGPAVHWSVGLSVCRSVTDCLEHATYGNLPCFFKDLKRKCFRLKKKLFQTEEKI